MLHNFVTAIASYLPENLDPYGHDACTRTKRCLCALILTELGVSNRKGSLFTCELGNQEAYRRPVNKQMHPSGQHAPLLACAPGSRCSWLAASGWGMLATA